MDSSRFLACLEADYWRIREVAPGNLEARVTTCPEWTVADLTRHVAEVYLHKVEMMRQGRHPKGWPPTSFQEEEPVELLIWAYGELRAEFAARKPEAVTKTWYDPDQTVGFWIRRMAQETVIHRIDAELGAGTSIAPVPDDLALDGIDELLKVFVAYSFDQWPEDFTETLNNSPGHLYRIQADATAAAPSVVWQVKTSQSDLAVEGGPDEKLADPPTPDATVSGPPAELLRWAWNRETSGGQSQVRIEGNGEALAELRQCVVEATQ
ncbi:MAG TPA: maleylpyruvate isomerase family mycothiol-dependent enzyme [Trebonia sp.]|jgi:uncharacterized protein (TIGR03083 family)